MGENLDQERKDGEGAGKAVVTHWEGAFLKKQDDGEMCSKSPPSSTSGFSIFKLLQSGSWFGRFSFQMRFKDPPWIEMFLTPSTILLQIAGCGFKMPLCTS